jgi:RimJ/RimL family protein N-acetyltransferase
MSSPRDTSSRVLPGPAYRIETARTCIRCWNPEEAPLLKEAVDANLRYLRTWLAWVNPEPDPLEVRIAWIRKARADFDQDRDYAYSVFTADGKELIGGTGLHTRQGSEAREIGYWIREKHAGKGLATEVSAALTRVAFEVDRVKRVHIHCATGNAASARVAQKLGFVKEGTLRKRIPDAGGEPTDMMVWTMFAAEYPASIPSHAEARAFDAAGRRLL